MNPWFKRRFQAKITRYNTKVSTPHAENDLHNNSPNVPDKECGILVCIIRTINIDNILSNSKFAKRFLAAIALVNILFAINQLIVVWHSTINHAETQ